MYNGCVMYVKISRQNEMILRQKSQSIETKM